MKLPDQVAQYKAEKLVLMEGLKELRQYLASPKFAVDTTVQIADIELRINEILNCLYRIETIETMID